MFTYCLYFKFLLGAFKRLFAHYLASNKIHLLRGISSNSLKFIQFWLADPDSNVLAYMEKVRIRIRSNHPNLKFIVLTKAPDPGELHPDSQPSSSINTLKGW